MRRALKKLCCEDYLGKIIQCNRGPCRSKYQCHQHFLFNRPVNVILERSVSKLYLMVDVHFCATSFQLFTTSSSAVGAPPAENTLGHYKWRRPSSKIRDFCRMDIFSTGLLLCSKLQLESLFGRRPLDRE